MLFKLIKHNLKSIFKSILPFAIAFLASIIFFNLTDYDTELIYNENHSVIGEIHSSELCVFLHGIASFLISCSLILLVAATLKAIWRRFSTSFYSDQAYLTHTLPISRKTLWNAQILSMFITFTSVIVFIIINCFILLLTEDGQRLLDSLGLLGGCARCLGDYRSIEPLDLGFYLSFIFIVFAEFVFMTLCSMTGTILKNRFQKNISLISACAIYLIGGIVIIGLFYFISSFDPAILDMLDGMPIRTPGFDFDTSYMNRALLYIGSIYACYSIILYFVDQKLLQRGINLD